MAVKGKKRSLDEYRRRLIARRKRRGFVLLSIALLVVIIFGINLHSTHVQLAETQDQIKVSKQRLNNANQQHAQLKLRVRQLNSNFYLGQLARDKYYFTKSGEKVYILPGQVPKDVTQN